MSDVVSGAAGAPGGADGTGRADAPGRGEPSGEAPAPAAAAADGDPRRPGASPDLGAATDRALDAARRAIDAAVATLRAAGARTEVLAEFEPERRVFGVLPRPARLRPIGRVWRLGVLVLDDAGRLYEAGRVVRAERPARRSITANAVAEHRAYRAAAVKGGIAEGETVVFDARPIEFDAAAHLTGPAADADVQLRDGVVQVRWSPTQANAFVPLDRYLAERADLLAHPPQGA